MRPSVPNHKRCKRTVSKDTLNTPGCNKKIYLCNWKKIDFIDLKSSLFLSTVYPITPCINLLWVSWTVIDTTSQSERFIGKRLFLLEPLQSGLYFRVYVDEAVPILDIAGLLIKRKEWVHEPRAGFCSFSSKLAFHMSIHFSFARYRKTAILSSTTIAIRRGSGLPPECITSHKLGHGFNEVGTETTMVWTIL